MTTSVVIGQGGHPLVNPPQGSPPQAAGLRFNLKLDYWFNLAKIRCLSLNVKSMPKSQLHHRLSDEQVKAILNKYTNKEISAKEARQYLEISKSRFYQIIPKYEDGPLNFSIQYERTEATRALNPIIEKNILKELKVEKEKIVNNPDVPTKRYNYSYIQDLLVQKYHQKVSVPTITSRAKINGYWQTKPPKRIHDREILTNFAGELIQHDSSFHLWAPDSSQKWYLITSLDDYSRALLYADFWLRLTIFTDTLKL
jgi:hypothetical protein